MATVAATPAYIKHRIRMRDEQRRKAKEGRDAGSTPLIVNVRRRERCRFDLKRFCVEYNPRAFFFDWSPDHDRVIERIQECVFQGALFALAMPRGSGKALALDTPLPTPTGWTTMGDVQVGDQLFDDIGNVCSVVYATEVQRRRDCYKIRFDDGETIVCDVSHLWNVHDRFSRQNPITVATGWMLPRLEIGNRQWSERRYSIPMARPIVGHKIAGWVEPYILGAWLGDGSTGSNEITIGDQDVDDMRRLIERYEHFEPKGRRSSAGNSATYTIGKGYGGGHRELTQDRFMRLRLAAQKLADGEPVGKVARATGLSQPAVSRIKAKGKIGKPSLRIRLRWLGVLQNKHIPQSFLRATEEDRIALLQGLMDTDGSIADDGQAEYTTKLPKLRDGIMELLASLGFKRRWRRRTINGAAYYRITFSPTDGRNVFALPRKVARQVHCDRPRVSAARRIVSIEPTESVPVRCIQVDSHSQLYLCGRGMIPTHNTTIARMAALWAVSNAHVRYPFIIGANAQKAEDSLKAIKLALVGLPEYAEDFPEIAFFCQALEGIAQRRQLSDGEPTLLEWSQERIVLPTVNPPANWPKRWALRSDGKVPTAGAVISASGLTGEGIRGSLVALPTGEQLRPDLVLLDDPQTAESARSPSQNQSREQLVAADVLGMAGPGKRVAAIMPCTVIAQGDFVDRILDRRKNPLWRGERCKMLRSMPTNLEAWDRYFAKYLEAAQKEPPTNANDYYLEHQAELEAGAEASWQDRKFPDEVSAIQHAMHIYVRDKRAFLAEYQNDPMPETPPLPGDLTAGEIAARVNGHAEGIAPARSTRLTAFIDVQAELLWYLVAAWDEHFGGAVVDYGAWPGQGRDYFTLADARPTLASATGVGSLEGSIWAGLEGLVATLASRSYRTDTGGELRLSQVLIDSGWGLSTAVVKRFCRESPHRSILTPSKGYGIGAGGNPIADWQRKPGERRGDNWIIPPPKPGAGVLALYDANQWKSFVMARLATPAGERSGLQLYGDDPKRHGMLCDHLTAEYRVRTSGRGRELDEWKIKPGRPDNHLLDCLVGAAVAASIAGARLAETTDKPAKPRPKRSLREWQERARNRRIDDGRTGQG